MRIFSLAVTIAALCAAPRLALACQGTECPAATQPAGAPARPPKPIPDQEPEVTQQVRTILLQHADGKAAPERYTERAGAALFPGPAKQLEACLRGYGALDTLQLLERKTDGEDRQYRYRAIYRNAQALVDITFNKAGRVSRFSVCGVP